MLRRIIITYCGIFGIYKRTDSRLAPSQWEMSLRQHKPRISPVSCISVAPAQWRHDYFNIILLKSKLVIYHSGEQVHVNGKSKTHSAINTQLPITISLKFLHSGSTDNNKQTKKENVSHNGLTENSRQVIIWTDVGQVQWRIYASRDVSKFESPTVVSISMNINTLRPRQMDAISQTTFSNTFSWMKMLESRLKFHWSLFPMVQLTIFQH